MWRQYPHRLAWAGCDRQAKKSRSAGHLTVTFGMRVVLCSSIWAPSLSRWEEYGWQLGKITDTVTMKCHPPRKFNYRIMWADGHTRAPPSSLSPTTATAPRCLQLVGHPAAKGLIWEQLCVL